MQTYGDYFSPGPAATREGAAPSRSAIPQIELTDRRWVDLVYIPADVLADEYPLTVIEYRPDGQLAPRLYTQREMEQVAELKAGDPAILDYGSSWESAAALPAAGEGGPGATEDKKEEAKPEGNELQTELEVKLATDPKLIEAVKSEFTRISLEKCSSETKPLVTPIPMLLSDGRSVPVGAITTSCVFGNIIESSFFFAVKINDPLFQFESKRTFCRTPLHFEDTRRFLFTEKQKSTKVNFQLGLNFAKLPLPPEIAPSKDGSFIPKEGDPAFKNNERLQQKDANGALVNANFNFGLIRQYIKVSVNEFRRVLFSTPGRVCSDL